ncbi:MAG: hypothetical protein P4N41_00095 [Negativicutes bacterium]|nr:hypothetical protein [Negativicutes bacterium]
MSYFFLAATLLASIYTYTFARWLHKSGNIAGAWGMYALITVSIAVAAYRIALR